MTRRTLPATPFSEPAESAEALERDVLHGIRLALGKDQRCVLFRIQTGNYEICDKPPPALVAWVRKIPIDGLARAADRVRLFSGRRVVTGLGHAGGSDLYGFTRPNGRAFALEVKRPGGRATAEQELFLELVRGGGGFGAVVDSVKAAVAALDRACAGDSRLGPRAGPWSTPKSLKPTTSPIGN